MIQGIIHPLVFWQKFNSKYYSKHDFPEKINSTKYSKLSFPKIFNSKSYSFSYFWTNSIQKYYSKLDFFLDSIQKIIQNWIFSQIQFKEIFIQYQKRSTSHPIPEVSYWFLAITYRFLGLCTIGSGDYVQVPGNDIQVPRGYLPGYICSGRF